jgi:hypothetical protein
MQKYRKNWRKAAIVVLASWSATAFTQEPSQKYGPWVWSATVGATNQFSADFSDGPGDVSVARAFVSGGLGYAWNRNTSASLSIGYGSTDYDFSSDALIENRKPWGPIEEYRLSVPIRFSPNEKLNAIVIPSIRSYAESGASVSDGRTEGVLGGFSWKFSDTLSIGPGIGWFSEVGDDRRVFPILLVDWQITDSLSLNTGRGMAASQGPGLSLNYTMNQHWTLGLTARREETRFALKQTDDRRAEIGQDSSTPLLLTANYSPWPMTNITALIGIELGGSMSLEDGSGHTVAQSDVDTAMMIGFAFQSRF